MFPVVKSEGADAVSDFVKVASKLLNYEQSRF